jgi:Carboxypeptidase regulatory-like domain
MLVAGIVFAATVFGQSGAGESSSQNQPNSSEKKDKNSEPATTKLKLIVTDSNGKPVGNASVYVRFNETVGVFHKDKQAELNLKTNEDGTVKVPEVPQGKILIQVVAKGLHTYGKWYDIEKAEETVQIKLEPAPHWY